MGRSSLQKLLPSWWHWWVFLISMLEHDPVVPELVENPIADMTERTLGQSYKVRRSSHVSKSPPGLKGLNVSLR